MAVEKSLIYFWKQRRKEGLKDRSQHVGRRAEAVKVIAVAERPAGQERAHAAGRRQGVVRRNRWISVPLQSTRDGDVRSTVCRIDCSWAYVKRHELQDPKNGRLIHTNQEMKDVFRMDQIEFTQVAGLISKHLEKKP
ncbi:hypothetical protein BBJ28_00017416 [Nothophytophthora sp. Chile5]|nr:hypothetical protein BBJ28_00017416 [Nothophytophthora sp. Chile5]